MRVATWNLWWKFGPWEDRQIPIADALVELDPDVCCLQEVFNDDDHGDQAVALAAATGKHMARTESEPGVPHGFGNALLSRWPIRESFTLQLPGANGAPGHRSALFALVDVPVSAEPWWFVSTHLEWRYDASALRQRQLEVILECLVERRGRADGAAPMVIGGDLNAVAESDELRRLTGLSAPYSPGVIFTDSWASVGVGSGHTWSRENPHSANAQWPRRRLDHVLVGWPRPKPTGNPISASLFGVHPRPSPSGATVVPSDHYGVVVELDQRSPEDLLD